MSNDSDQLPAPPKERGYTLSEAALEQRRSAAKRSTGPTSEDGKAASSRNSWKHGQYSVLHQRAFAHGFSSYASKFGKPCRTTCPVHPDNPDRTEAPCSLVTLGRTRAGESCLDKSVYVDAFDAIIAGLQERNPEYMHGVMAAENAAALQIMYDLREYIAKHGPAFIVPMVSDEGKPITDADGNMVPFKILANPAVAQYFKALEVLGINMPELLLTPRAHEKDRGEQEQAGALQTLVGGIFARGGGKQRPALPAPVDDE